jgi:hypothetical protein
MKFAKALTSVGTLPTRLRPCLIAVVETDGSEFALKIEMKSCERTHVAI